MSVYTGNLEISQPPLLPARVQGCALMNSEFLWKDMNTVLVLPLWIEFFLPEKSQRNETLHISYIECQCSPLKTWGFFWFQKKK